MSPDAYVAILAGRGTLSKTVVQILRGRLALRKFENFIHIDENPINPVLFQPFKHHFEVLQHPSNKTIMIMSY